MANSPFNYTPRHGSSQAIDASFFTDLSHDYVVGPVIFNQLGATDETEGRSSFLHDRDSGDTIDATDQNKFEFSFTGFTGSLEVHGGALGDTINSGFTPQAAGSVHTFYGEDGNDRLIGGVSDSVFYGGDGNDRLQGGPGLNHFEGGAGRDRLQGGSGANDLFGDAGDDKIEGGSGANLLSGGDGDDHLFGGSGRNTFIGGAGHDSMSGGPGENTFVYQDVTDSTPGSRDVIFFNSGDHIDLSALGTLTVVDTFSDTGAAEVRIYQTQNGSQSVLVDGDGDGTAEFSIKVFAQGPLTAADLILAAPSQSVGLDVPVVHHAFVEAPHPDGLAVLA